MNSVIKIELNRNLTWWSTAGMLVFLLIGAAILQVGIAKHKVDLDQQKEFIDTEMKKVQGYINYHQYGENGFWRILEFSPLSALFYNSTTLNDLLAFMDSGVRLKLMKLKIGKNLFEKSTGGSLDLSWYFMIIGSLVIAFQSFFTFRNREFIRYKSNFTGFRNACFGIILARIIVIFIFLAAAFLLYWVQYFLNGIGLAGTEILGLLAFILLTGMVWVFLLFMSAAFGAVKHLLVGGLGLGVFLIIMVLIWPEVLNLVFSNKAAANMKSAYKHELRKIEKLMEFEKEAFEYSGRYKNVEEKIAADKRMGEKWWDKDFKKIEKLEDEMREKTRENAQSFQSWSNFNPVTFFKSVNNELSSRGYNAFLEFCRENLDIYKGFLRYVLDKKRYESYTKVEPYLPEEQLVSHSKVSLPAYFAAGLILNLGYLFLALLLCFYRYKRFLFPCPEKGIDLSGLKFNLGKGKHVRLLIRCFNLKHQFLNVFYGYAGNFPGEITIDGQNIVTDKKKDFVYIPKVSRLPRFLNVRSLLSLVKGFRASGLNIDPNKRLNRLSDMDKFRILVSLAQAGNSPVYILDDYIDGIDINSREIARIIKSIKESGNLIIEITSRAETTVMPDRTIVNFREGTGYGQEAPGH
jgi:hypothetical protein